MMNRMFKISWLFVLAICTTFLTSCDKESTISTEIIENYVDESVEAVERSGSAGRGGCFEFVFPISIELPDGSSVSVDSYENLRSTLRTWKEENPESEERPALGFPIEVISEDGAVITIADREELIQLKRSCPRSFKKRNKKKDRCFKLVFPVSIDFPDGTNTEFADKSALKSAIRTWKEENPDAEERPVLAFPVDIELEDGTIVNITNAEELQAQKESCKSEGE